MLHQTQPDNKGPIIVDEDSVIPEVVQEVQGGGLLAPTDYSGLLVSMSGYDKPQEYTYGYRPATRPDQASGYPAFAQPNYGSSYLDTHAQVPHGLPTAGEMPLLSGGQYDAHDTSYAHQDVAYSSYMTAGSRQMPAVSSYTPGQGPAGRKLIVYLSTAEDLDAAPAASFNVVFGTKRCHGMLAKHNDQSQRANYALFVDIPPFDTTGSSDTQLSLFLEMGDSSRTCMSMPIEFGLYTYTDATAFPMSSPSQATLSRKRKHDSAIGGQSPGKRTSMQSLRSAGGYDPSHSSPVNPGHVSPFSQSQQTTGMGYAPPRLVHYPNSANSVSSYGASPHQGAEQLNASYTPYNTYLASERATAPASSSSANPPLVRTSALHGSPTSDHHSLPPNTSFNPYAMFPSNAKAVLKLDGELMSMTERWTADEWEANRRLVRFRRSQNGSVISASFEPVTPEDHARAPGNIYVNCIWWKEKGAWYITSVDTIQLLESLVAVRFTVEEKNRIRRNLEGFRPMTVSKTKPECEEFFKIIMGFPSPKPRNIEKDVKVFPWRVLSQALKKIIGKYSASYSSTAGALPPTATPASMSGSSSGHQRVSPPSAHSSAGSLQYPPHMAASTMSSHAGNQAGLGSSAGVHDLRLAMPTPNLGPSMSWHQPSNNYTTDLSQSRGSWDFGHYVDNNSPAVTTPSQYRRIPSISQSLGLGNGNSYFMPPSQDNRDYWPRPTQA